MLSVFRVRQSGQTARTESYVIAQDIEKAIAFVRATYPRTRVEEAELVLLAEMAP